MFKWWQTYNTAQMLYSIKKDLSLIWEKVFSKLEHHHTIQSICSSRNNKNEKKKSQIIWRQLQTNKGLLTPCLYSPAEGTNRPIRKQMCVMIKKFFWGWKWKLFKLVLHESQLQHHRRQLRSDLCTSVCRSRCSQGGCNQTAAVRSRRPTWEKPCGPVRRAGCGAYWTTGSGRPGWATWRCRAGFGWGCCRWCAVPSGGWGSIASCSDFSPALRVTHGERKRKGDDYDHRHSLNRWRLGSSCNLYFFAVEEKVGCTDQISPARPSKTSSHWPPRRPAWWCNICEDLEDHIFPLAYLLIWKAKKRLNIWLTKS